MAQVTFAEDFISQVTRPERLVVKEGFEVERLYSVPKKDFGSWVVLCEDDKGRRELSAMQCPSSGSKNCG